MQTINGFSFFNDLPERQQGILSSLGQHDSWSATLSGPFLFWLLVLLSLFISMSGVLILYFFFLPSPLLCGPVILQPSPPQLPSSPFWSFFFFSSPLPTVHQAFSPFFPCFMLWPSSFNHFPFAPFRTGKKNIVNRYRRARET